MDIDKFKKALLAMQKEAIRGRIEILMLVASQLRDATANEAVAPQMCSLLETVSDTLDEAAGAFDKFYAQVYGQTTAAEHWDAREARST